MPDTGSTIISQGFLPLNRTIFKIISNLLDSTITCGKNTSVPGTLFFPKKEVDEA